MVMYELSRLFMLFLCEFLHTFVVQIIEQMKNKFYSLGICFLTLACMFNSCNSRSSYSPTLVKADSLITLQQDEEAYKLLTAVNVETLNERDRHYYDLLLTQAQYKNYIPFASDSIINSVVDYYEHHNDGNKYTKALIFQGCVNEDMGNPERALECYKQAEKIADKGDSENIGYIKLRLGALYQSNYVGSYSIAIQKYREALALFQNEPNSKRYELVCMSDLGSLLRNVKEKEDSAVYYLENAYKLATELGNRYLMFSNKFMLAEFYSEKKHNYEKAKSLAYEAINIGGDEIDHPRAHCTLAISYLKLNKIDSAELCIKKLPTFYNLEDSMWYFNTLEQIAIKKRDNNQSFHFYKKIHELSDSLLINNLNTKLLTIEKKYDKKEEELKNERLQSSLNRSLFMLVATILVVLILGIALLRYRRKLNDNKEEYVMLTTDLNNSLIKMNEMQSIIDSYDSKVGKSAELHKVIDSQINAIHELVQMSHELPEGKFLKKFQEMMAVSREESTDNAAYWNHLQLIANELHDGIINKAIQLTTDGLRMDEINFLSLFCCGYSNTGIMVCMHYTNIRTVYNKKRQIADKLGVKTLEEFVKKYNRSC